MPLSKLDQARGAIYERAAELTKDCDAETLVKISDAVAKVAYGPQGATTDYTYKASIGQATTTTTHYADNGRRGAGFSR